ncbi:MAG: hypothetical protein LBD42_05835 [Desulfovibrio sp.]|jgi:hypothetical protein|nr:hypothetical protein [Desulfovibrio sp.]
MKCSHYLFGAALLGALLPAASCVLYPCRTAGTTITLEADGEIRNIPAQGFDEAVWLKRGYVKNTDAQGNALYVFVSETDRPPEEYGNTGQGSHWYGDRGGGQGSGGMGSIGLGNGGYSEN